MPAGSDEVEKRLQQWSSRKAFGKDKIPSALIIFSKEPLSMPVSITIRQMLCILTIAMLDKFAIYNGSTLFWMAASEINNLFT